MTEPSRGRVLNCPRSLVLRLQRSISLGGGHGVPEWLRESAVTAGMDLVVS